MLTYILLIIGFALLIKGADFLVDGAGGIARILKVSDLAIGLTIVAFGTSCPELFVNIFASTKGSAGIAIGNILGSNILNILFILGVSAVIYPLKAGKGTVWKEIPLTLLAAVLLGILANDQLIDGDNTSVLTRIDGLVLISFFIIFVYYVLSIAKAPEDMSQAAAEKKYGLGKSFLFVGAGLFCLMIGAKWTVGSAVKIALAMGVSESLIGLTIVATGTSLPELVTSAVAAYKKNTDIAVGNIVGSNIFNIFFVLGISSIIRPIPFEPRTNADISVTIFASLLLFICMFVGKKHILDRWQGWLFVSFYTAYLIFIIMQG